MDILNSLNELSPEQQELVKELLRKQGVDVEQYLGSQVKYSPIQVVEEREYYPLSSAQKRLYILSQMEGASLSYNMPIFLKIEGRINKDKLEEVFKKLIQRHEALRTSFDLVEGEPVQKIHHMVDFNIECMEADEEEIPDILSNFIQAFDLGKAPLLRVKLISLNEENHILAYDMHHIVSDGITMSVLVEEFGRLYNGEVLKPLRIQYKDFAVWQNKQIESGEMRKQEEYWLGVFNDEIPVLNMPSDYARPTIRSFEGDNITLTLGEKLTRKLNTLSKETGSTIYIILLSAYNILLSKYTGQEDIIIGSPIAGRPHADLEYIMGMFVNTLAMRNYPCGEKKFSEFLREVKENSLKAYENQDYQFELLIEKLGIKRDLSRNPLFDTVFVLQNTGSKELNAQGLKFIPYDTQHKVAKFDMTLIASELKDDISLGVEYCTRLFRKETIERLLGHYVHILEQIVENPDLRIADINVLTNQERKLLLYGFNDTKALYPLDKTIHGIFEEQAKKTPSNIAVVFGDSQLTYRELNEKANQLAGVLRKKGVGPDRIVAIMVERSLEMIVGILGILKAGGVYLPIDPNYPEDRISFMLEDSEAAVLLVKSSQSTDRSYHTIIKEGRSIEILDLEDESLYKGAGTNPKKVNKPSDMAYIIYTSGTTGKPKGAMIEHRNVVRLLFNDRMQFDFNSNHIWTMFHSMSFDFSVWEIYGALLYGGRLVIVPKATAQDPAEYLELLKKEKVTVLNQTPTAFYNLVREEMQCSEKELNIRYVIFGGEALKPAMLKDWRKKYPETKLINMYGITETTVHVTYKEITEYEIENNISNIGRPIPTLSVYILDRNMKPVPVGVPGELCVGGDGVCRGYLNRPALTAEKFVPNPFVVEDGNDSFPLLYRSGDLARFLPDGEMEYLGRIDHQVKIRGHRIELGEIDNQLLKHPAVKEAVVLAREDKEGNKYLCAYIVDDREITVQEIRDYLSKELPDYMIPSYFVQLDKIPLTSNGKVDRKSLPEPDGSINTGVEYAPPESEAEKKLVEIWQEVLRVDRIGVNDSFFSIGGDSIKAISIISKINKAFGVGLQIKDIYLNQSIRMLAACLDTGMVGKVSEDLQNGLKLIEEIKQNILNDKRQASMLPSNWEDFYPLSQIQSGMVFYSKLRPDEPIYHDQFIFTVKFKQFNYETYFKALNLLMKKHPILRTTFDTDHFSMPLQVVHKDITPVVLMEDISDLAKAEQEKRILGYLRTDMNDKFRFDSGLLWRIGVFKLDYDNYYIVLSFQHAILDGWSVSTFNRDFIEVFSALLKGESCEVQQLKNSYKEYVALNLSRKTSEKTREFWKEQLLGYSRNKLPFNFTGKKINGAGGSKIYRKDMGKELLVKLEGQAKRYGCSVRDLCLSAHVYLLGILSTEKDVVTGVVTHDRPVMEDAENILGCYLNTIPIRLNVERVTGKTQLLESVKKYMRNVKEHELFLSDIAAITGNSGNIGNPIFDTLFNFTDFHVLKDIQASDSFDQSDYDLHIESNEMTNTLFDLEVSKTLDSFSMQIKYAPDYFYEKDIVTALNLYINVLEKFADESVEVLRTEELITLQEKNQLLYEFNNTRVEYPKEKTMHQLFEEQAERTPDNTALVFEDKIMTYGELNARSNQLARMLVDRGVKIGDNVGLITRRGFDMIVGMYAILKAGAAYVPIDPEYPQARMEYIAKNSNVSALLSDNSIGSANITGNLIYIDYELISRYPSDNLNIDKDSKELAYTIYTSGSTGLPKGVMIEHHSAVNLINWVNKEFAVGERDALLFITSMCFDLSVYDIFGILAAGGKIVIAKKEQVQNPKELAEILSKERITFWDSVPSTMNYLVNSLEESGDGYLQENLRLVFMSGDWIPVKLPGKLKKYFPNASVISLGGATEGTIWSIYYPIEKVTEHQTSIPYGRPIDNNFFYILDDNMMVLPAGVAGELYIGGVGVARGYMNEEERTKASFVKDRFTDKAGGMMYKTGDLGRMLPDGNIEFLGRKDHQVKIRGYRVELGEIESQLQKHEQIKDAVVADRTDAAGNKFLCAYIVSDHEISVQELRDYLSRTLPDYMLPSYYMRMESLPLTPNGKIDRKALPEPEGNLSTGTEYEAPANDIEVKLVQIWEEILETEGIGATHNFFELGGHSLKATALASKIHKELNVEIPLREIFSSPTVREIAKYIEKAENNIYSAIEPAEIREYYTLSPAQRRLYLISQMEGASVSYNTPDAVELVGSMDKDRLEETFNKLIARHEALRTSFEIIDGEPKQKVHDKVDFSIEYADAKEQELPETLKKFVRPFDLAEAPLLRVTLINTGNEKFILAYDMHHIISDGISMNILVQEFARLYNGEELKPLRIQYKDFSEWQNSQLASGEIKKQEKYWLDMFKDRIPVLNLPTDYTRPAVQSFEGSSLSLTADAELTGKINTLAGKTGSTLYMILLSAYNILLSKYAGQEDIVVGSPIAGRPHADLEGMIGMFVNTLAMRNNPAGEKTFVEFLEEVKGNALKAFENQDYQFEELVEKLDIKRDLSRNPLFDVMFVLQNTGNGNGITLPNIKIAPYQMEKSISKLDLTLEVAEVSGETIFRFEYCTRLFKTETVARMAYDYFKILNYVVEDENIRINNIMLESRYKEQESVISENIVFNF